MKVSEVLVISVEIVQVLEKHKVLDEQGQIASSVEPSVIALVAQDIVGVLKAHNVSLPANVSKVVDSLPLILPLLTR